MISKFEKLSMSQLGRPTIEDTRLSVKNPIILVLENIRSAFNVGSIFRTADAFNIQEVLLCGYTAFPPHKEIAKTALGATESVVWQHFKTTQDCLSYLHTKNIPLIAVEQVKESVMLNQFQFNKQTTAAFVFGNEVVGVEQSTLNFCSGCIEIPQFGSKHSLNVGIAAGIVIWHLLNL
ncbi:MAG: RNA methyltransferase [Alphaproteobacteria bacterium]|nr:RNA methyltransferase [Alphaproteobacteria bacterium]